MSAPVVSTLRQPLTSEPKSCHQVSDEILAPIERGPTALWWAGLAVSCTALLIGSVAVTHQIWTGIGTWGLNKSVGWAWDITNFVFWVGIGHAGTLISAVLLLFRQRWRTGVNRSAEAMTIFAVMCAGIFPLIHMGRPWLAFWMAPYPNMRGPLWVNFRSPLLWDAFAVSTYFTVSAVFWYVGLIPDLALARDRAVGGSWKKKLYGLASLGWNGSARTWSRYEKVCLLLAGLATPLVFSVHTIVSFDFATSVVPGWHSTIFPPYFVCGAIFSGMAMVLTLMIIARRVLRFESYITLGHIGAMCKMTLMTSCVVSLAYMTEWFTAWYGGNPNEWFVVVNRALGPYRGFFWLMVFCNMLVPQLFWFEKVRRCLPAVFVLAILVNVGMWLERFVIIVTSLHRDYLPSSWAEYSPTWVEIATFIGSFGLFFTGFFLFARFLPFIAQSEVKGVIRYARAPSGGGHAR